MDGRDLGCDHIKKAMTKVKTAITLVSYFGSVTSSRSVCRNYITKNWRMENTVVEYLTPTLLMIQGLLCASISVTAVFSIV